MSNGTKLAAIAIRPISFEHDETKHSTQKPVECMRRPIVNNSDPGQVVYEPFLGSGTTLIAAQTTSRVCLGLEIEPRYVDVAIRRWQSFTGEAAIRQSDGTTFADVQSQAGEGNGVEAAATKSSQAPASRPLSANASSSKKTRGAR